MPPIPSPTADDLRCLNIAQSLGHGQGSSNKSAQNFTIPELRQRDIFSFAYQITKGMNYLSDMKVSKNLLYKLLLRPNFDSINQPGSMYRFRLIFTFSFRLQVSLNNFY